MARSAESARAAVVKSRARAIRERWRMGKLFYLNHPSSLDFPALIQGERVALPARGHGQALEIGRHQRAAGHDDLAPGIAHFHGRIDRAVLPERLHVGGVEGEL